MSVDGKPATFRALARSLSEALDVGEYDDGTRLPTEAELAATHCVSRQTVRRAMQDLVTDGLVYRVPGRGTFATDRSERYLRHFGSIEELMGALPPDVGELLRGETYLSTAGSQSRVTVIGLLDDRLPSPFREAEQSVTATIASERVAALLGCEPGAPILQIDRTYFDETGRAVELAVSHFDPSKYSYRVRLRRQPT